MKYLIALMIIFTQPALAEWTEASSDIRGNKYFVDMESIRINGNYRKYWGLINFSSPQNQSVEQLSQLMRGEVDCKEEQSRWLSIAALPEDIASGEVQSRQEERVKANLYLKSHQVLGVSKRLSYSIALPDFFVTQI